MSKSQPLLKQPSSSLVPIRSPRRPHSVVQARVCLGVIVRVEWRNGRGIVDLDARVQLSHHIGVGVREVVVFARVSLDVEQQDGRGR